MNDKMLRNHLNSVFSIMISSKNGTGSTGLLRKGVQLSLMLAFVLSFTLDNSYAQDRIEVTGTVTDAEDGSALPGASIIVEGSEEATGSTIGTTTSMDGTYTLRVPENLNTLVVSFIGYITQTVEIDGRTTVDIQLESDVRMLDDVVVVGYGEQDRREITSAVASVSEERFVTGNINETEQLLQGKVAGLVISRPGSDPDGGTNIRLRGLSTIGANKEPLIVIDGAIGGSFDSVDPRDVESIEVLKDASASAIYGTRGASGVILITTKSGSFGGDQPVSVTYSGQVTSSVVANRVEMMSPEEFRNIPNEAPQASITDFGASTDWWEEITQTAYNQSHNLAVSGGNESTSYRLSGSYRDIQGIQKGSGSERLNTRLNLTHRALNDKLTLTGILSLNDRTADRGSDEAFRYAQVQNPTAPIFDEDGEFNEITGFDRFNPVAINQLRTIDEESNRMNLSIRGEYDFRDLIDGLGASIFYSRDKTDSFRGEYRSKRLEWGEGKGRNGLAFRRSDESRNQLFESTLNYSQSISNVRLESVAGYSYQEFEFQGQGADGGDFPSDAVLYHNLSQSGDFDRGLGNVFSYRNTNKLIAFFGRANFVIDNTYFLSGTYRREGSTRFGTGNKWGNFFAVSGGAELTNIFDISFADELKFRVSYGETGNNAPSSGLSQLRFGTGSNFLVDGNFVPSLGPVSNPNPDLKWEIKREWNVGLDFAVLDERLTGSFDYFQNTTDDLLLEFTVPVPPNLFPQQWINIGELSNEGFEAALDYIAVQGTDFFWRTGVTFATQETILESLSSGDLQFGERQLISNVGSPGLNNTPMIRVKEGRPIGEIWGKEFAGISSDGEWLFFDANGDIVTSSQASEDDDRVIGNGMPDFQLGVDNTFRYKNWDLNMFWRGAFGHDLANTYNTFYKNPNVAFGWNVTKDALDLAELEDDPQFSSFYVEDASFLRLENLTIGYTVNTGDSSALRNFRIYASGNNLWTITGYEGIDPEVRFEDGGNPLAPGIERRNTWFTQTSFVLGIDIGF